MILKYLKSRTIGYWFRVAAIILAIVPLFYMANAGGVLKEVPSDYTSGLVCLIFCIVALVVSLVFDGKRFAPYLTLAGSILLGAAFSLFAVGSVLSIVDYVYNIVMWGDPTQFSAIIGFGIVLLLSTGTSVAACWMK